MRIISITYSFPHSKVKAVASAPISGIIIVNKFCCFQDFPRVAEFLWEHCRGIRRLRNWTMPHQNGRRRQNEPTATLPQVQCGPKKMHVILSWHPLLPKSSSKFLFLAMLKLGHNMNLPTIFYILRTCRLAWWDLGHDQQSVGRTETEESQTNRKVRRRRCGQCWRSIVSVCIKINVTRRRRRNTIF